MTRIGYLKCEVCGKITQIKLEASYNSTQFYIYIPCKNCDTLFVGNYNQDDEKLEIHTNFINAEEVLNPDNLPDYFCTITQDFISQKIRAVSSAKDTFTIPSWIKFSNRLGDENLAKTFSNIYETNLSKDRAIFEWNRVLNLWFNNKYDLLKEQLEYFLDAKSNNIELNDEQNYLSAIRKLTTSLTYSLFPTNEYNKFIADIRKNFISVNNSNESNTKAFVRKLGDLNLYFQLEKDISERIAQSFEYINDLTPIRTLFELTKEEQAYILDTNSEQGIFTTSFDRVKLLYIDSFETIIKTLVVPIGLNNILVRGSHNSFKDSKIDSIDSFQKLGTAFKKMNYLEGKNPFEFGIKPVLNNKLRNSIGHCSYELSNINQIIRYNKGKKDISLIRISYEVYQMILYLIKTFSLLTLLHEAYYKFYK